MQQKACVAAKDNWYAGFGFVASQNSLSSVPVSHGLKSLGGQVLGIRLTLLF